MRLKQQSWAACITLSLCLLLMGVCGDTLPADLHALQLLLSQLGTPAGLANSWQGGDPCALQWRGIACSSDSPQKVVTLDLSGLHLFGPIPESVGGLVNLHNLHLARNNFSSSLPASLASLSQLQTLDVSNNSLSGTVPAALGTLPLTALYLQSNFFVAPLPLSLARISTLKVDPSVFLFAPAPAPTASAATNITSFASLDPLPSAGMVVKNITSPGTAALVQNASSAACTGGQDPWPCFCNGGLPGQQLCDAVLGTFNACNCNTTSCLPCPADTVVRPAAGSGCDCVSALTIQLRLANASLSAFTPSDERAFLQRLAGVLAVQPQQLTVTTREPGSVVLTILLTPLLGATLAASAATTVRDALSTAPADPQYGPVQVMQVQQAGQPALSGLSPQAALATGGRSFAKTGPFWIGLIVLNAGAIGIVLGCLVYCRYRRAKQHRLPPLRHFIRHSDSEKGAHSFSGEGSAVTLHRTLSLQGSEDAPDIVARYFPYQELHQATGGFDAAHKVGDGGSSVVYRGRLKDGRTVAVKQLTLVKQSGVGDREFLLEVALLSRLHHLNLVHLVGYCGDAEERLLVYEFMHAGTLREALNGSTCKPLDWEARVQIALGAARGLEYLHESASPRVIHRDFKSSNILLDKKMRAKVSDFGMAKQMREGSPLNSPCLTQVLGTFGYFAPEYAMMGRATIQSDIFSFGVVLLELISGRAPVDMSRPRGQESLVLWASPLLHDEQRVLSELADPLLAGRFPQQDMQRMALLALACLQPDPDQRPRMPAVVQAIQTVIPESQPSKSGPTQWAREVSDRLTQSFDITSTRRVSLSWGKRTSRAMSRPLVSGNSGNKSRSTTSPMSQTSEQKSGNSLGEAMRKTWVEVTSKLKSDDAV